MDSRVEICTAFVMQKVLQPLYFAREDTKTPFNYALHSMMVNAALAVGLAPFIGFIAAALGTTLSGWTMVAQLWWGSRKMGEAARADTRLRNRLPRILLASAAMGLFLWALARVMDGALFAPASLGATTIDNLGVVIANGPANSLSPT